MTRCSKCPYYTWEPLPKITKKIVYLDQLVFSHMLTAKDVRWEELLKRLQLLTYLQIITCPYSEVHEDESLLAETSRAALKGLYRALSDGNKFLSPNEIEQNQLLDAIGRHLRGDDGGIQWQKPKPWREFSEDDPHRWTSDLAVYADFPLDLAQVQRLKTDKEHLYAGLGAVADNWKRETNSFNDDVKREALSYGKALLEMYRELAGLRKRIEAILPLEMLDAFKAAYGPDRFDPNTPPGVQPGVMLVHWLAAEVHNTRPDEPDPVAVVEQFFQTIQAMEVPFQYIASRLWASIAPNVRSLKGARRPKASDHYDVTAISHYAPYCDAMIVDNEFYAMATQKNIDVPRKFGVKLFCSKKLHDFIDYLDDLVATIPHDHRIALKQVFPHLSALSLLKTE